MCSQYNHQVLSRNQEEKGKKYPAKRKTIWKTPVCSLESICSNIQANLLACLCLSKLQSFKLWFLRATCTFSPSDLPSFYPYNRRLTHTVYIVLCTTTELYHARLNCNSYFVGRWDFVPPQWNLRSFIFTHRVVVSHLQVCVSASRQLRLVWWGPVFGLALQPFKGSFSPNVSSRWPQAVQVLPVPSRRSLLSVPATAAVAACCSHSSPSGSQWPRRGPFSSSLDGRSVSLPSESCAQRCFCQPHSRERGRG